MRFPLLLCGLLLCTQSLLAQQQAGYREQFNENIQTADSLTLKELLTKWEKSTPDDPELYPAWFNYYVRFAIQEVLQLSTTLPNGTYSLSGTQDEQALAITQENDSTPVGYIHGGFVWNEALIARGLSRIDQGIAAHPDRLDFRFGKIHVLLETEKYLAAVSGIEETLLRARSNDGHWLWTDNEPLEEEETFMQECMQDYFARLYSLNTDEGYTCANTLLDILLTHYPKNIMFRTDRGVLYVAQEMYRPALEQFLSVLKDAPDDFLVMSNVGYTYMLIGDKQNAESYYKRLLERCQDEDLREQAQEMLNRLKQK